MRAWRLTVRHGPRVERESFDGLDEALAAMERAAERIRGEGGLAEVNVLRTFAPRDRVAARLELSAGGWLRGRTAGVDVMGDGGLVAFAGGVRRRALPSDGAGGALDAVRRELEA